MRDRGGVGEDLDEGHVAPGEAWRAPGPGDDEGAEHPVLPAERAVKAGAETEGPYLDRHGRFARQVVDQDRRSEGHRLVGDARVQRDGDADHRLGPQSVTGAYDKFTCCRGCDHPAEHGVGETPGPARHQLQGGLGALAPEKALGDLVYRPEARFLAVARRRVAHEGPDDGTPLAGERGQADVDREDAPVSSPPGEVEADPHRPRGAELHEGLAVPLVPRPDLVGNEGLD